MSEAFGGLATVPKVMALPLGDVNEDSLKSWFDREALAGKHQAARALMMFRGFLRWCAARPEYRKLTDRDAGKAAGAAFWPLMTPVLLMGGILSMIAAFGLAPMLGQTVAATPHDIAVSMALGAVVLTGGMALYTYGSKALPTAELTLMSSIENILAPIWVWLLLGETASSATLLGGAMVLAESLYADLRGSGVKVQLANPGFIETRLTAQNSFSMPFIMTPEKAAGHMMRLMRSNRFKSSFPAPFSGLFRYGQGLPDWLWYRMFPRG